MSNLIVAEEGLCFLFFYIYIFMYIKKFRGVFCHKLSSVFQISQGFTHKSDLYKNG